MVLGSSIVVVSFCIVGVTGLLFCGLGIWGIVTRKPFPISGKLAWCHLVVGVLGAVCAVAGLFVLSDIGIHRTPGLPPPAGSSAAGLPFDLGPRLHEMGRPAIWNSQSMALGNTGFVAHVGPGVYEDKDNEEPDYYSMDVEMDDGGGAMLVYFQRDLRIDELPEGFLRKSIGDIVSYDPTTRSVSFSVGARRFEYHLPQP
jgi:hypothetical protein